jgi:uncharacterized phage protein (TIGR01671 family)
MREIKFRAWEKNLKEIITVHNIDFEKKMINTDYAWRLFNEIELMQYTGLKDKNGKEIYEGDILKVEGSKRKYVVKWNDEEFAFTVNYQYANGVPGDWILSEFRAVLKTFEVIGNVFENKELLNETTI